MSYDPGYMIHPLAALEILRRSLWPSYWVTCSEDINGVLDAFDALEAEIIGADTEFCSCRRISKYVGKDEGVEPVVLLTSHHSTKSQSFVCEGRNLRAVCHIGFCHWNADDAHIDCRTRMAESLKAECEDAFRRAMSAMFSKDLISAEPAVLSPTNSNDEEAEAA